MPNRRSLAPGRARPRLVDPPPTDRLSREAVHAPAFEDDDPGDVALRAAERLRQVQEITGWEESWPFDAWPEEDGLLRPLG